jgi:hypothetical protein
MAELGGISSIGGGGSSQGGSPTDPGRDPTPRRCGNGRPGTRHALEKQEYALIGGCDDLQDVEEEMAATFTSFDVVYRRTLNFAAHLCAKHSLVSLHDYIWHTPLSFLKQCLQHDCNTTP